MMLAIGVLIGKGDSGGSGVGDRPRWSSVGGAGTSLRRGATCRRASTSFKSDWPSGKEGYTVEIGTLSKQGTTAEQVEAAKSDASAKGASDVGALDSDEFGSLPSGNYVIYSGVYDTKADATKALKPLKSKFPDAKVIEVSTKGGSGGHTVSSDGDRRPDQRQGAARAPPSRLAQQDLEALSNASGQDYVDQSRNLPDNIATAGRAAEAGQRKPRRRQRPTQVIK